MSLTERAITVLHNRFAARVLVKGEVSLGWIEYNYRLGKLCDRLMSQDVRLIDAVVKNS